MRLSKDGDVSLRAPGFHERIAIGSCTLILALFRRGQGRSIRPIRRTTSKVVLALPYREVGTYSGYLRCNFL
jgi:hypothetical protein